MSSTSNKILSSTTGFNFVSCLGEAFTHQLYENKESPINIDVFIKFPQSQTHSDATCTLTLAAGGAKVVNTTSTSDNILYLNYFQSSLFATVLEDAMCSLKILEECNNPIRVIKTNLDMTKLLARKFAVPKRLVGDYLDDIDASRLDCLEYKLQKLEDDRQYLNTTIIGVYIDLSLERCFLYLSEEVKIVVNRNNYRETLVEDEANNRVIRRDLNRQLRHKRNHIKSVYYETDSVIQDLRTRVEDAGLNTKIRSRYVGNWQTARTEQHLQVIHDKESKPLSAIMHFKQRTDQEHRVHTEVELLMNITINENLQKIEEWMNKYETDMEAMDLKIQKKRNQLEDMINKTKELEETIEEHARLCKNWVTFKEQREEARLYQEKMTNAAIAIQAWWRGLLVRYQLGPYKVVKRPPPPADKKKKKK